MNPVMQHEQTFVVRDEGRELHFTGVQLAAASSFEDGKHRWTDMVLFRTRRGAYVLSIVGKSIVKGERDICAARVCDDAAALVESLNRTDDRGVRFLSIVARDLLDEASQHDDDIAQEYGTQHID